MTCREEIRSQEEGGRQMGDSDGSMIKDNPGSIRSRTRKIVEEKHKGG